MFEFASHNAWLIPGLPLMAAVLIGIFGSKLKGLAHVPAILAMLGSLILSLGLVTGLNAEPHAIIQNQQVFEWFSAGGFHVAAAINVDQLTAVYLSFITGIGLLIFIYAAGYMKGDYGYWRFFAYLSIFVFFMTCLVMGNNFILLYLGWEGVGLASYLLIGYYYPRPSAVAAAKKAFITNRIGDFGLAIGVFLIYKTFGTVNYTEVFSMAGHGNLTWEQNTALYWIPFCLMLGAFGKSAQFPLHVWLPDAMEGPTPVSALIHAATMVTAGIYLIARTMPLFHADALLVVGGVGCFTMFLAATIALCQYDLKRIWAYSTLSQLGYMFMALGAGAAQSGVFHVFTHAFFKALLFLSAGSVMHAMGGELDIRKMSGIRKVMPITNITMLIGCIALAGVPGFAGFFSKDEIIHHTINNMSNSWYGVFGVFGLITAFITAFYTFRVYFKVFMGPEELPATAGHHEPSPFALAADHGHDAGHGVDTVHAHQGHEEASHGGNGHGADHGHDAHGHAPNDGSPLMWVPLLVLCIGAIGAGYLGFSKTGDWFHKYLDQVPALHSAHNVEAAAGAEMGHEGALPAEQGLAGAAEHGERIGEGALLALGVVLPIAGIGLAFYFYLANRRAADAFAKTFAPIVSFLYHKWYWDEIYYAVLLGPLRILAHICYAFDRYFLSGLVSLVGFAPQIAGFALKPTQRGLLQRYAVGMIAGIAAVVLGVLYLLGK